MCCSCARFFRDVQSLPVFQFVGIPRGLPASCWSTSEHWFPEGVDTKFTSPEQRIRILEQNQQLYYTNFVLFPPPPILLLRQADCWHMDFTEARSAHRQASCQYPELNLQLGRRKASCMGAPTQSPCTAQRGADQGVGGPPRLLLQALVWYFREIVVWPPHGKKMNLPYGLG